MEQETGLTVNFPLNKAYANLQTAILRLSVGETPRGLNAAANSSLWLIRLFRLIETI